MRKFLIPLLLAVTAPATASFAAYEPFTSFPQPAAGSFTVVGATLPDGRLAVWNGDTVYLQFAPDANLFTPIASGYSGDPGFLLYEPLRNSLLLGAGFSGNIYRLDLDTPMDYSPAALLINTAHYSALALSDTLLLVDAGLPGFAGSQLEIVDIGGAKFAARNSPSVVVRAGAAVKSEIVEKPPFTYSASLALDAANGIVYAMSAFGTPKELRFFTVAELLQAYTSATPLDWATDGTLVGAAGQFNDGGVAGILSGGHLVIPGIGSIQIIDPRLDNPALATVVESFDPTGLGGFYNAIVNPVTGVILAVDGAGGVYVPVNTVQPVPAIGLPALLLLCVALGAAAAKRLK